MRCLRTYELELIQSAEKLARDVIQVKKDHKVLIVTDSEKLTVGNAFALTCRGLGAETVIAIMPISGEHGSEPPTTVAAAMQAADIVLLPQPMPSRIPEPDWTPMPLVRKW